MANILKVTPQEVTEKAKAITSVKSNMENYVRNQELPFCQSFYIDHIICTDKMA